jgi:Uma2 family endonuclease
MVAEQQLIFLTAREFSQLPESPYPVELIDGVVTMSPTPLPIHQLIASRLAYPLIQQELRYDGGFWFTSPVDLFISPTNVYEPDAMFFPAERKPDLRSLPIMEIPEIVVEILSPSSRSRDQVRKRAAYSDRGIAEYWIVDPQARQIIFNSIGNDGTYIAHALEGSTIPVGRYTGVALDLEWIFEQ